MPADEHAISNLCHLLAETEPTKRYNIHFLLETTSKIRVADMIADRIAYRKTD